MRRYGAFLSLLLVGFFAASLSAIQSSAAPREDPQIQFTRVVFGALSQGDSSRVSSLIKENPYRIESVINVLLTQASGPSSTAEIENAARNLARIADSTLENREFLATVLLHIEGGETAKQKRLDHERLYGEAVEKLQQEKLPEAKSRVDKALQLASTLAQPFLSSRSLRLRAHIEKRLGDLENAIQDLNRAIALDRPRGAKLDLLANLLLLAEIKSMEGDLEIAVTATIEAVDLAPLVGEPFRLPQLLLQLSYLHARRGNREESTRAIDMAHESAEERNDINGLASVLGAKASLATTCGDYTAAIRAYLLARTLHQDLGDRENETSTLIHLGGLYSEIGRFIDAEDVLKEASERLQDPGHPSLALLLGRTRSSLGLTFLDQGKTKQALSQFDLAEQEHRRSGDEVWAMETKRHRAYAYLEQGRHEEARSEYRTILSNPRTPALARALSRTGIGTSFEMEGKATEALAAYQAALIEPHPFPEGSWRARYGVGRIHEARGETSRAKDAYLAALKELDTLQRWLPGTADRQTYLGDAKGLHRRASRLLAKAGENNASFVEAEAGKARLLLEMQGHSGLLSPAPLASPAREKRQKTEADLVFLERQLRVEPTFNSSSTSTSKGLEEKLKSVRIEHQQALLAAQMESSWAQELQGRALDVSLESVQQALPPDAALIEYLIGSEGSAAWVLTRRTARFINLGANEAAVTGWIDRIYRPIELLAAKETDIANLGFDARAAGLLHATLVKPLLASIGKSTLLYIVPDGPLLRLPFSLLVSAHKKQPVRPGELYAHHHGCRFLIEDFAISYLPTAGILLSKKSPGSSRGNTGVVIASPDPLPPGAKHLAAALSEARAVAKETGASMFTLGKATETRAKEALSNAPWIHLATHGFLSDRRPLYSRIALAPGPDDDGWLHAFEVERLKLTSRLVILSACETAEAAERTSGWLGLSRSFLLAGATSVVASFWVVDDEATRWLFPRFHRELANGLAPAMALQRAQVEILRNKRRGSLHFVHPFFWAGFIAMSSDH